MRKMKLSDIKISEAFANTIPKEEKLEECRKNWNENHCQDRFVVVNRKNILIDGYIQYLILKENNMNEAEVKISNKRKKRWNRKPVKKNFVPKYRDELTTYIFGVHPYSEIKKEFVWRVPKTWSEAGWEDGLSVGDSILVDTKFGTRRIEITKIEFLDECPIDIPVKRVVKRLD